MSNQMQQLRIDLKIIEVDEHGKVIINNQKLSEEIKKAKESGVEYVFLEAETGSYCVSIGSQCPVHN
ncbi:MAG: hypothetical protein HGB14_09115 [Anaerolineaceae bacterium]|jgi:hypothetical protein|nr:hypothetical protein [Anaerolineaceae bacterium]